MTTPCWIWVCNLLLFMLFLMTEFHNVCNNSIFITAYNLNLYLNVLLRNDASLAHFSWRLFIFMISLFLKKNTFMFSQHCVLHFCIFWRAHILHLYLLSHSLFCIFCNLVSKNVTSPGGLILFKLITVFFSVTVQFKLRQTARLHNILFLYFCAVSSCSLKHFSLSVKFMTLIKHYTTRDCTVSYESHGNWEIKATSTHSDKDISE